MCKAFSQLLRALHIYSEPTDLETKKVGSTNRMAKVLATICVLALIAVVAIAVFLKDRQPTNQREKEQPLEEPTKGKTSRDVEPVPKPGAVISNCIGMKLVYIPAGSFIMGSSLSAADFAREYNIGVGEFANEFPQHKVRISEGFWIGQTEVTQGQYKSVMNAHPWSGREFIQESANNPAVYVTWDDALEFCRKLSQQEGKTCRLPTEAEWEYACRAGTTTRFSFGDSGSSLGDYAWFWHNIRGVKQRYAHPVGQKRPNPWGLYDMHGNVWEWCSNRYSNKYYSNSPSVYPKGLSSGDFRSLRGGSWDSLEDYLRCSFRLWVNRNLRNYSIGFRVVLSQP